jgi:hypothetical protein
MLLTNSRSGSNLFVWNESKSIFRLIALVASMLLLSGNNAVEATGSTCIPSSSTATSRSASGGGGASWDVKSPPSKKSHRDRSSAMMTASEVSPYACAVAYDVDQFDR